MAFTISRLRCAFHAKSHQLVAQTPVLSLHAYSRPCRAVVVAWIHYNAVVQTSQHMTKCVFHGSAVASRQVGSAAMPTTEQCVSGD